MSIEDLAKQAADSVRAILEEAQKQAAEIVSAAEAEAKEIRERAEAEARERLERAREAFEELGGRLGMTGDTNASDPPPAAPVVAAEPEPIPEAPQPPPEAKAPEPEPTAAAQPAAPSGPDDSQAARMVALKLALDGVSRDDARSKLAADYTVPDLDGLLEDVYAKAGK